MSTPYRSQQLPRDVSSTVNVTAMAGDIGLGSIANSKRIFNAVSLVLFPAAAGQSADAGARGNILNDGATAGITVSEVDPALLPSVLLTASTLFNNNGITALALPATPLHQAIARSPS